MKPNQNSKDQIYLGKETLAAYRNALDEISRSVKQISEAVVQLKNK